MQELRDIQTQKRRKDFIEKNKIVLGTMALRNCLVYRKHSPQSPKAFRT